MSVARHECCRTGGSHKKATGLAARIGVLVHVKTGRDGAPGWGAVFASTSRASFHLDMDDPVLSPAEAELLDYTATLRRCCERLSIERHDVAQLLSAPPDDPFYLPHVRVRSCGRTGLAYRVRPDDLEALAARISTPPLPPDPIRPRDAIAVRAGERVRGGSRR